MPWNWCLWDALHSDFWGDPLTPIYHDQIISTLIKTKTEFLKIKHAPSLHSLITLLKRAPDDVAMTVTKACAKWNWWSKTRVSISAAEARELPVIDNEHLLGCDPLWSQMMNLTRMITIGQSDELIGFLGPIINTWCQLDQERRILCNVQSSVKCQISGGTGPVDQLLL